MSANLLFPTCTALYKVNLESEADVTVDQGGSSSGKTYALVQVMFTHCYEDPGCIATVAGQDLPNLRVGALRDAEEIYNSSEVLQSLIRQYNKSENTFYFWNGSILEFKAYQNFQDAKSGKRDYLFVNEGQGISYEIWKQLYIRTKKKAYIDYNPNAEFWVHEKLINTKGVKLIISDHRHNPFVVEKTRRDLEALKEEDLELWKVYARGLTGKIAGLIFRNYHIVDAIPEGATLIASGLDFGFTNDPTSFGSIYKQDGELWIDEQIYETGLTNPMIAAKLRDLGISTNQEIIADSAEPKSIKELQNEGFYITPAVKGADSIKSSIDILKRYKINITRRSIGLKKEIANYKWKIKNGESINEPVDFMNHTIDWMRYVAILKLGNLEIYDGVYDMVF